ncbi:glycosyltransferase [Rhodococcus sp. BP-349]|uniref:glycosyltransferase n=1 Tax=unclassified Rhodococcus (in: high G+C Gram-positive bacteria) TaxID=192944 RepID=UPI001C9AD242|nr:MULTISPECIES: glycosyltransferase [unclassified Rhodococcus (in: high G+C Gram-positive bacteria)]MBY6539471.1 glycosyltransferase [Rhodococcus sp. BP-363]MBY6544201.1 glycosyltransferase [Rhodococcus sp. BP-369]MBY6563431.1 glycosyltransferase [Rhodococcus sp. BP-370]MBY6577723.1 glycosyltransferase [Rhodococcus sp. BP-364]MBY6587024.1 glycosyltransferase [Rhodococcus sp. BP-358]
MTSADGVVVAMVSDTWADAVRRGFYSTADQMIMSLMEDERVPRVLVADHPRGVLSRAKSLLRRDVSAPHTPFLRGVRPWVVSTRTPTTRSAIERRYRAYDRQLAISSRRNGMAAPSLVTFNLYHAAYGSHDWASRVCFYAQDDESAIPRKADEAPLLSDAYRRVAERGIEVVAVSSVLLRRIDPTGPGHVVPNGVVPELWSNPSAAVRDRSESRTTVAYAGSIDSRLDVTAIAQLAAAGHAVQLAGHIADAAVGRELEGLDGVTLLGAVPRASVASFLASADVCLMAHRRTPLTEAMSPLKVYEYLCTGRPVVATSLGSYAEEPDVRRNVTLVDAGGDYVRAVEDALRRGPLDESVRALLAESLSWRRRHEPVISRLSGSSP